MSSSTLVHDESLRVRLARTLSIDQIPEPVRPTWMFAILAFTQLAFLCSTFNNWSSVGIVFLALIGLVVYRGHKITKESSLLRYSTRRTLSVAAMILFSIVVMTVVRMPRTITEGTNFILVGVDAVAHGSLLATIIIWFVFPRRGHVAMLFLGMLTVLLCVASGGVSRSMAAQTTVGLLACLGFVSAAQVIVPAILRDRLRFGKQKSRQQKSLQGSDSSDLEMAAAPMVFNQSHSRQVIAAKRKRLIASIVMALAFMMVTGAVANITEKILPAIQSRMQTQLQASMVAVEQRATIGGTGYVEGSRIGNVRDHLSTNPEGIALTVYSNHRPGYLRGNVFDYYQDKTWITASAQQYPRIGGNSNFYSREVDPLGAGTIQLQKGRDYKLKRFQIREPVTESESTLEIHGDRGRGNKPFLPMSTRWLELRSAGLSITHHDIIKTGFDVNFPYVAGVSNRAPVEAMPMSRRRVMTLVQRSQRQVLQPLTRRVCGNAESNRAKAAAVSRYFQSGFSYGLVQPDRPSNRDPVLYFLETKHVAHCELFASATALMLRTVGVPTRYVTGYVVDEYDRDKECWVGRNRHAHAWVEAYDDSSQSWFAVESTPGRDYFSVDRKNSQSQQGDNDVADDAAEANSTFGFLSTLWGYITSVRATEFLFGIFRYGQIVVLIALAVWFVRRLRGRGGKSLDPEDHRSLRLLSKVSRKLQRHGLVRQHGETLHGFANRVESTPMDTASRKKWDPKKFADWLRSFERARYQGQAPPEFDG